MTRQLRSQRALGARDLLILAFVLASHAPALAVVTIPERADVQAYYDQANYVPALNQGSVFGSAVAATAQYLAIGMQGSAGRTGPAEAAFIYDPVTGNLLRTLTGNVNTVGNGSQFGCSIAIEGNLAVIGAEGEHITLPGGTTRFNSGAAYVFDLTTGAQISRLVPTTPFGNSYFGSDVAIKGGKVVVGSWGNAYLFDALSGQQLAKFAPSETSSQFGISVAMNDSVAVIGANSD